MQGYNPFAPESLTLPEAIDDQVNRLVRQGVKGAKPADRPFVRKVDVWALAIGFAVALELPPVEGVRGRRFADGAVLQRNPQIITLLELLAIARSGDPQIVADPKRVITIANGLAAAGADSLLEAAGQPGLPVWKIGEEVYSLAASRVGPPLSIGQFLDD
jgi:hypothetical protein